MLQKSFTSIVSAQQFFKYPIKLLPHKNQQLVLKNARFFTSSDVLVLLKRIRGIPSGIKSVIQETVETVKILRSNNYTLKNLSRRQYELIRSNKATLQKLSFFLIANIPPIVGSLFAAFWLCYPRQLLTKHFWDENSQSSYLMENYEEKRLFAMQLLSQRGSLVGEKQYCSQEFDNLSADDILILSGANGICGATTIYTVLPTFWLRRWLRLRANEIAMDDTLLVSEGLGDLSAEELQMALYRRGFNPTLSSDPQELRQLLQNWLDSSVSTACRNCNQVPVSLLMHATALPEVQWVVDMAPHK